MIPILLPPLRERLEDIEPLVEHFIKLQMAGSSEDIRPLRVSQEAMQLLTRYSWLGNVRELRGVLQRGQILCDDNVILPQDLPEAIRNAQAVEGVRLQEIQQQLHLPPEGIDLRAFLGTIERTFVREALERCNGNQVQAAALLGISRDQLRYLLP